MFYNQIQETPSIDAKITLESTRNRSWQDILVILKRLLENYKNILKAGYVPLTVKEYLEMHLTVLYAILMIPIYINKSRRQLNNKSSFTYKNKHINETKSTWNAYWVE